MKSQVDDWIWLQSPYQMLLSGWQLTVLNSLTEETLLPTSVSPIRLLPLKRV